MGLLGEWWPWAASEHDDAVARGRAGRTRGIETIPNAGDTKTFADSQSGARQRDSGGGGGGGGGVEASRSPLERARDNQRTMAKIDARANMFDVDSIEMLERRYAMEFATAERAMKEKSAARRLPLQLYDYESDRRFLEWKKDQKQLCESLKIHWMDQLIDRPLTLLTYYARVGTTTGLMYGVGRATYLYRTMDKTYAKLHGVTFATLALQEGSVAVIKGAAVALAGTAGVLIGDSSSKLIATLRSGDVAAPERTWSHVWACCSSSGAFAGAAFAFLHRALLTPWGMTFVTAGSTLVASSIGLYAGYAVYRPYAAQRTHRFDDPYWRPWNERKLTMDGPKQVRGKYI